jgi:hypothetical protein
VDRKTLARCENPVWEHVIEVETAWKAGVKLVNSGASRSDFDEWFLRECRENWKICIVTREENRMLGEATTNGAKGMDRYRVIKQRFQTRNLLRPAIIQAAGVQFSTSSPHAHGV